MIVKIHRANDKKILAVTDSDIAGKKFEEKGTQLDLTSDFYKGEEKTEQEIIALVFDAYLLHMVGHNSVKLGIRQCWIDKTKVITVRNIPHAEVLFY